MGGFWKCSFGNQLNTAVACGGSWSHSKIPLMENLHIQSFMKQCEDSNFLFDWGWQGEMYVFLTCHCWVKCSISFDLNSVLLSECSILGKPNLRNVSKNN